MYEDRSTIGLLDNSWNDLDVLNQRTKMLHDKALDAAVEGRSSH